MLSFTARIAPGFSRKDFAMLAIQHPCKWALFAKLDGKDYRSGLWDGVRPAPFLGPRQTVSEDTA